MPMHENHATPTWRMSKRANATHAARRAGQGGPLHFTSPSTSPAPPPTPRVSKTSHLIPGHEPIDGEVVPSEPLMAEEQVHEGVARIAEPRDDL